MESRKQKRSRHDCCSPFSGKIICGDCGSVFGSKVWHSTSKYRRVIWQCNHKFDGDSKCTTPHLYEDILKARFMDALAEYLSDPEERIEGLRYVQNCLCNTDFIDADIEALEKDQELTAEMARSCIMINASPSGDDYNSQYIALQQKYNEQKLKYNELVQQRNSMRSTSTVIGGILFELTELKALPLEWNDRLWVTLTDHVTVYADDRLEFVFKDGTAINEYL